MVWTERFSSLTPPAWRRRRRRDSVHLNRRRALALLSVCQFCITRGVIRTAVTALPANINTAEGEPFLQPVSDRPAFVAVRQLSTAGDESAEPDPSAAEGTWYEPLIGFTAAQLDSPVCGGIERTFVPLTCSRRPDKSDRTCSHARVWLQVPGEAKETLPVSALQQSDAGARPSVHLWTPLLWHLPARISEVCCVFVCTGIHLFAGDTGNYWRSFGWAAVNKSIGVPCSPFFRLAWVCINVGLLCSCCPEQ